MPVAAMGSGSDYSPFMQHLGIATLDVYYEGEDDQDGVYHSIYDSYDHYVRFGDPGFVYGVAEAQTAGRAVLRMANVELLPLQFEGFATTIDDYRAGAAKAHGRQTQARTRISRSSSIRTLSRYPVTRPARCSRPSASRRYPRSTCRRSIPFSPGSRRAPRTMTLLTRAACRARRHSVRDAQVAQHVAARNGTGTDE